MRNYEELKADGPRPRRTTNHGITFSFHYRDPNGNNVEFSAQNFLTLEAITNLMSDA